MRCGVAVPSRGRATPSEGRTEADQGDDQNRKSLWNPRASRAQRVDDGQRRDGLCGNLEVVHPLREPCDVEAVTTSDFDDGLAVTVEDSPLCTPQGELGGLRCGDAASASVHLKLPAWPRSVELVATGTRLRQLVGVVGSFEFGGEYVAVHGVVGTRPA